MEYIHGLGSTPEPSSIDPALFEIFELSASTELLADSANLLGIPLDRIETFQRLASADLPNLDSALAAPKTEDEDVEMEDGLAEGSRYASIDLATTATEALASRRWPLARMRRDNRQALPADQLRFICNRTNGPTKCGASISFKRESGEMCVRSPARADADRVCKRITESHRCLKWATPAEPKRSPAASTSVEPQQIESQTVDAAEESEEEQESEEESEPEPEARPRRAPKGTCALPQLGDIFLMPKPFRDVVERFAGAFPLHIDQAHDSTSQALEVSCAYDKGRQHPCPWRIHLRKDDHSAPWRVSAVEPKHDHRVGAPAYTQLPPTPRSPQAPTITSSKRVVKRRRGYTPPIAPVAPVKRVKPNKPAPTKKKPKLAIPTPEPSPRERGGSYFPDDPSRASTSDTTNLSLAEYLERTIGTDEEMSESIAKTLAGVGLTTPSTLLRLRTAEWTRVVEAAYPQKQHLVIRLLLERLSARLQ